MHSSTQHRALQYRAKPDLYLFKQLRHSGRYICPCNGFLDSSIPSGKHDRLVFHVFGPQLKSNGHTLHSTNTCLKGGGWVGRGVGRRWNLGGKGGGGYCRNI